MVDPHREAVLVRPKDGGEPEDRTSEVVEYVVSDDGRTSVRFSGGPKWYPYAAERVLLLRDPRPVGLPGGARVEVDGCTWQTATEVLAFTSPGEDWFRIFSFMADGREKYTMYRSSRVRVVEDASRSSAARDVLSYLRTVVSRLPDDDPLHAVYASLDFVHPESALARYLSAALIDARQSLPPRIFPFRRNLSQWQAVENSLRFPLSVIEGPPGTGKTETILNLVATIISGNAGTVGVVSFNNAAVENVRDKLGEAGFGHVVAALGNKGKREAFFASQQGRNDSVAECLTGSAPVAAPDRLVALDEQLRDLYARERERAELRRSVDAFRLEREHFAQHLQRHEVPELDDLPLLRRSSERIIEFLAETRIDHHGRRPGLVRRIRRYFKYGSLRGQDPQDTDVVLRLQEAFYESRISELQTRLDRVDSILRSADFDRLTEEHRVLSVETLRSSLRERYRALPPHTYSSQDYRSSREFPRFTQDYPVLLSTCHSIRRSIADGYLLDYLVIDEASQVDLLSVAPALACCHNVVVVGDLQQLAHIDTGAADGLVPPAPAYDYRRHSILSSLIALYGTDLPRMLLREHYRCDPAIIGFCNRAFYGDRLLPLTTPGGEHPMVVVPTARGNHMRQHRAGGRTNQRELDVILEEVLPRYCRGVADADIGITTPYRRQVDKAADVLDRHEADTVHRFQGRQKKVVILSTVIDDTRGGRTGLAFVDDPRLVNVAVSRAVERFILVTDHKLLPASRHLRDLIRYVRYQNPGSPLPESSVVSVFDLLYREYSDKLLPLARNLRGESEYRSEAVLGTLLGRLLQDEQYAHLTFVQQVPLISLLADRHDLTRRQDDFVRASASVDFVVYNRVTNDPVLAIEVDGFAFHENNPEQLARDRLKDDILKQRGLPLLRLPTTGSGEERRIRAALDGAEVSAGRASTLPDEPVVDVRPAVEPAVDRWRPRQDHDRQGRSERRHP